MNTRRLTKNDWYTLSKWWADWPKWKTPSRNFLPDNGTGGLIVEKNNKPIVAGFIYLTNSRVALLEWIISNPNYREHDRDEAIITLITSAEKMIKNLGYKYAFSVMQHNKLIKRHEKLGWKKDSIPSYELTKVL